MLAAHQSGITKDLKDFNNGQLWKALRDPHLQCVPPPFSFFSFFILLLQLFINKIFQRPSDGRKLVAHEVLTRPPYNRPGAVAESSNFNYAILGAILEIVSGKYTHFIYFFFHINEKKSFHKYV
jgi:CubicO group peptidase (beta-lactamase class C family)